MPQRLYPTTLSHEGQAQGCSIGQDLYDQCGLLVVLTDLIIEACAHPPLDAAKHILVQNRISPQATAAYELNTGLGVGA